MSIALVPAGDEFIFTHIDPQGGQHVLTLSENDVVSLAQSAESFRAHIVARHTGQSGHHPVLPTLIDRVELDHSLLERNLLLSLFQANGRQYLFSLPRDVAEALPQAISAYLAAMGTPDSTPKH